MTDEPYGIILTGLTDAVRRSYDRWARQAVDWDLTSEPEDQPDARQTTIGKTVSVTGPGTFFGRERRTLTFEPTTQQGWWFDRTDQADALPIRVSVRNVWTTVRNIVLRSGSPHNYMRMVEHIIALRLGMGLDNVMVKADSGDPPLFDRGSMDLVEALDSAGVERQSVCVPYVTVKEPVTAGGANGSFLTFLPCDPSRLCLEMDCAIDFPDAIGRQRIRFNLNHKHFRYGALARTNSTTSMKMYFDTVGKLFADIRNMGYTDRNILIAGKRRYWNVPLLMHEGKSLEAAWHRALLDLLAAIALIDQGRFVGRVISYKAGHTLDVAMIRLLHKYNVLTTLPGPN
ncbi:MAG: UDP-3-O-acyl-N-acetylglucosamine deacetylase [Verrucomicrobia bacterium]|nr:UDP-3-O-acyl-N-acetylglucosamine deacetylase [Verrucomicrobiota bacterium]MBU4290680.1 UDP-3-O-acyl-N-acetylglucosamine deacetylase [Verrucomicrobiota bacterium]MBU4429819.1 UDP-3-O-acyl-N-acetylglucosamine deacetylase [Verrucomicrobiota bacterium]MCG2678901.1 UDP-3-O-acyl-N-acetylglucosamine deacetylase [Kiritimatiellia bacterium]